jgi:hypothetical protein
MTATKLLKRRQFLNGVALAGAAGATSALATPAIAQGKTEWKMVTTWPKNFPGLGTGANRFAESVTAATDGRLSIKVFAAGELVPPFESFDAVTRGAADLMHAAPYYWPNKNKGLQFYSAVPFGLTATETTAWMNYGGGQELWDKILDPFGLKGFHAGSTGVQMGGWFNKEIVNTESVKGMKMRIPGLGGEALKKLGMVIINPAPSMRPSGSGRTTTSRSASTRSRSTTTGRGCTSPARRSKSPSTRRSSPHCRRTCSASSRNAARLSPTSCSPSSMPATGRLCRR